MKLTFFGKLVLGGMFLLIVGVIYMLFFKPDTSIDTTLPAQLTYRYPFNESTKNAFSKEAKGISSYCDFSPDTYVGNRGIPIEFDALIAPDYKQSVYYYTDPETGEEYIPAYLIEPGGSGLANAQAFATEDYERLPECVPTPEFGGTGGLILLAFPKGQTPTSPYVRAYGEIWWESVALNPGQTATAAGEGSGSAQVIKVGAYDNLSPSQASDRANVVENLNLVIQRGPGVIRLGRIEYGDAQTRIWVELINQSSTPLEPWLGASEACLRVGNSDCLLVGEVETEAGDLEVLDENPLLTDILSADASIPPKATGGSISGYLIFPKVEANKELRLEIPDLASAQNAVIGQFPIVVRIPGVE